MHSPPPGVLPHSDLRAKRFREVWRIEQAGGEPGLGCDGRCERLKQGGPRVPGGASVRATVPPRVEAAHRADCPSSSSWRRSESYRRPMSRAACAAAKGLDIRPREGLGADDLTGALLL